jgi:hypothetical protein
VAAGPERAAKLALLAALARARGGGGRAAGAAVARVAEFAEDLAQPVVYLLEHGRLVGQVHVIERGEPADGRVDPGVTGGGESRPNPF